MNKGRKRILLVDDEEDLLQAVAEGLTAFSEGVLEVLTAENGRKALEIFSSGPNIDLLVTDLAMPEMNGLELLAHVEKDYPGTPAIVLTSLITPETEGQIKAMGDYVCIEKPVGLKELLQHIMNELRQPQENDQAR